MSLLINNNAYSGLQALAKVLQYSTPSSSPPSANTNVQKPDWQSIQSLTSSSRTDSSSSGLNVTYAYSSVVKTDLSMLGGAVSSTPAPSDSGGGVSSVSSGYDLTISDIENS